MKSNHLEEDLRNFLAHHTADQVPIVCVTSGGTIVPLEKNMVRFIDNFSGGERGSTSAECFLSLGYVVIFLHRVGSKVPFTRSLGKYVSSKVDEKMISRIQYDGDELLLDVDENAKEQIRTEIECYRAVKKHLYYFPIHFETVDQYLLLLHMIAKQLKAVGPRACFYLAAAVSDFYIPADKMCEHKIQSSTGLNLELEQVPKVLGKLCREWAPQCFVVSFKLETDESIVQSKAKSAIEKYGVDLVVANLLQTRREVCYLVSEVICHTNEPEVPSDTEQERRFHISTIHRPDTMKTIEPLLVDRVVNCHSSFYERANVLQSGMVTTDTYCSWLEDAPHGGSSIFTFAAERALAVCVKQYVDMLNDTTEAASISSEKSRGRGVPKADPVAVAAAVGGAAAANRVPTTTTTGHAGHHESHHHHEKELVEEVSRFRKKSALKVLTLMTVVSIVSFYLGRRWR